MIVFACFSPHPPIILPNVGSPADQEKVNKTIRAMEKLSQELPLTKPDSLIITSPHPDWGFNVPLHYLTKNLPNLEIKTKLTSLEPPERHFLQGKKLVKSLSHIKRLAWIASGDMSHRLHKDGPYGFHPSGPKYDQEFITQLKRKSIPGIINLDSKLVEEAGECGLRSFCLLLGAIEESKTKWEPKILSYEAPFGVGYLVARLV